MPSLQEQLDALHAAHASPKSDSKVPSNLHLFLSIYLKSEHLCCLNYMEGADILYNWLTPHTSLPFLAKVPTVPRLFRTYELTQLAKIISPDTSSDRWVAKRAIAEYLIYSTSRNCACN